MRRDAGAAGGVRLRVRAFGRRTGCVRAAAAAAAADHEEDDEAQLLGREVVGDAELHLRKRRRPPPHPVARVNGEARGARRRR